MRALYTSRRTLKSILKDTGSQCSRGGGRLFGLGPGRERRRRRRRRQAVWVRPWQRGGGGRGGGEGRLFGLGPGRERRRRRRRREVKAGCVG